MSTRQQQVSDDNSPQDESFIKRVSSASATFGRKAHSMRPSNEDIVRYDRFFSTKAKKLALRFDGLSTFYKFSCLLVCVVILVTFTRSLVLVALASLLVVVSFKTFVFFASQSASFQQQDPLTADPAKTFPEPSPKPDSEPNIQDIVRSAAPGEIVKLDGREYAGPLIIDKPLTLLGKSSIIWSSQGPVLTVASDKVRLTDIQVEVTETHPAGDDMNVALYAENHLPFLERVRVRGSLKGFGAEDGSWGIPDSLELGEISSKSTTTLEVELAVPVACTLSTDLSLLSIEPSILKAGAQTVTLSVSPPAKSMLMFGEIKATTAMVTRIIYVSGRSSDET